MLLIQDGARELLNGRLGSVVADRAGSRSLPCVAHGMTATNGSTDARSLPGSDPDKVVQPCVSELRVPAARIPTGIGAAKALRCNNAGPNRRPGLEERAGYEPATAGLDPHAAEPSYKCRRRFCIEIG